MKKPWQIPIWLTAQKEHSPQALILAKLLTIFKIPPAFIF
jgi:hypothetical protein